MRRILVVGAMAMLVAYGVVTYQLRTQLLQGYSDFISFYTAGKIIRNGAAKRLYDLDLQYQIQRESAPKVRIRAGALPYVRFPCEAWLFAPLANLRYVTAFALWNALSLALGLLLCGLAHRHVHGLDRVPFALLVLLFISYFPVFITLLQGQDALWLLLLFLLAYMALRRKREALGGMMLGLGMFKFMFVIPFLIPFIAARRLRLLGGFLLSSLVLAAVSTWTVGWRVMAGYPGHLSAVNKLARGVNNPADMPNIRGLVQVVLGSHTSSAAVNIVVGLLSLSLLVWLATKWRAFTPDEGILFSLAFSLDLVVTILVSYHAHIFDLVLLAPFLALGSGILLSDSSLASSTRKLLQIVIGCVLFSPLYFILSLAVRGTSMLALVFVAVALAISRIIADVQVRASTQAANPAAALG